MNKHIRKQNGFTLIEIAVVIFILGLLLGGLLGPLSRQVEVSKFKETADQLEEINQAILGFAAANGYIPCPASATSNGAETRDANQLCQNQFGYVPYQILGLKADLNSSGVMVDLFENPIRYMVSNRNDASSNNANAYDFTVYGASNAVDDVAMNVLVKDPNVVANRPDVRQNITVCRAVCNDVVGVNVIAVNIPYLLYSPGKYLNQSTLEQNNTDGNNYFVDTEVQEGVFEEILVWSSANTLFAKMLDAGQTFN